MWIATTLGFYSVVHKQHHEAPNGKRFFVIRARTRGDIERLAKEIKSVTGKDKMIHEYEKSDYQFRIYLENEQELSATLGALASKVTYSNFKEEIAEIPHQQDKVPAYSNLWLKLFLLTHKGIFNEQPSEA
jgi:hypothetical protein